MEHPLLRRAIAVWRFNRPISLTLAASLMELGFDVVALEAKHRRS